MGSKPIRTQQFAAGLNKKSVKATSCFIAWHSVLQDRTRSIWDKTLNRETVKELKHFIQVYLFLSVAFPSRGLNDPVCAGNNVRL